MSELNNSFPLEFKFTRGLVWIYVYSVHCIMMQSEGVVCIGCSVNRVQCEQGAVLARCSVNKVQCEQGAV